LLLLQRWIGIDVLLTGWIALIAGYTAWPQLSDWLREPALRDFGAFFAAGCLFYRIWDCGWNLLRVGLLAVTWICAMIGAVRQIPLVPAAAPDALASIPVIGINSLFFALFALLALTPEALTRGGRTAVALGALTYPLYLIHQKLGYVLINTWEPAIGRWVAFAAATLTVMAIAWSLHRGVERPYNARLRSWLQARLRWLDSAARVPQPQGAARTG